MGQPIIITQKTHDFHERLKFSHEAEDRPLWKECYKQFFPTMVTMVSHRKNGYWQHSGIDRSIILENSKQILVDEKVREKNYNDIALEHISNSTTGSPGWVVKSLQADYIAYAILPIGKCYLLPVVQLQLAWIKHGEAWKAQYFEIRARNQGYETVSTGVPVKVLFQEIGKCLRCNFGC